MKGRLGTGRHLDETYLLLPEAVPATDGGAIPKPSATASTAATSQAQAGTTQQQNEEQEAPEPSLFGSNTKTATLVQKHSPATSPLNLLGKVETWGVRAGTPIKTLHLNVENLTGAQLQRLIKELPDGLMYEVAVEMEGD